jgi:hypothetical protein
MRWISTTTGCSPAERSPRATRCRRTWRRPFSPRSRSLRDAGICRRSAFRSMSRERSSGRLDPGGHDWIGDRSDTLNRSSGDQETKKKFSWSPVESDDERQQSAFAPHPTRRFVLAQTDERRVTEVSVGRPLHEADLRDNVRRNPLHLAHLIRCDAAAPVDGLAAG